MEQERITVLLGAGAVMDFTSVSTKTLTDKVLKDCGGLLDTSDSVPPTELLRWGWKRRYGGPKPITVDGVRKVKASSQEMTFEDLFHLLEILDSYCSPTFHADFDNKYKIFSKLHPPFDSITLLDISLAARKLIDVVNEEVHRYDANFGNLGGDFSSFFQTLAQETGRKLDVFNLNYDTWVEQSLNGQYVDGYVPFPGHSECLRFELSKYLASSGQHTVAHPHGQILFGPLPPGLTQEDLNQLALRGAVGSPWKYKTYAASKNARDNTARSPGISQTGEHLLQTNVITGLMKTDKTLQQPFNSYCQRLHNALLTSSRLIIVGYGFADLYLNQMLEDYNDKHFNLRKALVIDYVPGDLIDSYTGPRLDSVLKTDFVSRLFKRLARRVCTESERLASGAYQSEDGMARLYVRGFKSAIRNDMDDIVRFMR